jgi:hypothetical protein
VKRLLLGLAALLTTSSCGMYTNVPAQIHVMTVKGATVTYSLPDTAGNRESKIDAPEITLAGEPGSVGCTFEQMKIDYFQINNARVSSQYVPPIDMRVTTRVESSNFPTDPLSGPVTSESLGKTLAVGKTTFEPPVVTRHVTAYGLNTTENAGAIWAQVVLIGTDDAGIHQEVTAYVPITFLGSPGTGK